MKLLKRILTTGLLALGVLASPAVQASEKLPSGNTYDNIGSKIEAFVDQHKDTTAGMGTAVFTADDTLYQNHFGYMNKETNLKADDNAVFEWGSITKTVTWISVMQQVEAGKINLKADIRTYLPKGFLKNLNFDKPVTMLDLMNHQGGFQEHTPRISVEKPEQLLSLEDYLKQEQAVQVYEPGTITTYSSWGTALAGYIVQRTSGQDFADYVHDHIFTPLGMKHSLIKVDRSDNAFVRHQRSRNHSYYPTGKLRGAANDYGNDYPAGSIIGTLSDMKTYAQALLKQEEGKIFRYKTTWQKLFNTSTFYGDSNVPKIKHGFFVNYYAVPVVGHSGGMDGYTSNLLLDFKNGVGLAVMTNQQADQTYTRAMPELIFGKYEDSPYAKEVKDKLSNRYYLDGAFIQGPLSYLQMVSSLKDRQADTFQKMVLNQFYKTDKLADGRQIIATSNADYLAVPDWKVWLRYASFAAAGLAVLYALIQLIYSAVTRIFRKIKGMRNPQKYKQTWYNIVSGLILSLGLLIGHFIYQTLTLILGHTLYHVHQQGWHIVFIAFLTLALISCLLKPALDWLKKRDGRIKLPWKTRLHIGLTAAAALSIIWFIYYWDLYQWWMI